MSPAEHWTYNMCTALMLGHARRQIVVHVDWASTRSCISHNVFDSTMCDSLFPGQGFLLSAGHVDE